MIDLDDGGTMKRDEWTVKYTGSQLAVAAVVKKNYHEQRLAWWKAKKETVIEGIRHGGVNVNESIVDELSKAGYANTTRIGHGPTVTVDPKLVADLQEAATKVQQHQLKVSEYDAWNQMMDASAAHSLNFDLTQNDYMFFFGK